MCALSLLRPELSGVFKKKKKKAAFSKKKYRISLFVKT